MSEKRFDLSNDNNIRQNGIIIGNDEVVGLLNEQQATIEQLQDLCGESDSENAKLRQENKKLQQKIDMLCEIFDYGSDESIQKINEWKKNKESSSAKKGKVVR